MQTKKANRITFTNSKSLYDYISKVLLNEDVDFIAGPIISHWHATGVDALVDNISQHKNGKPSGVIVIGPHQKGGFMITEADFICGNVATVKFCFQDLESNTQRQSVLFRGIELFKELLSIVLAIRAIKKADKKGKKKVLIASIMRPNVFFLQVFKNKYLYSTYYPMFSLIDEGLGTYMPKRLWKIIGKLDSQGKEQGHFRLARLAKTKLWMAENSLLEILATRYINTESLFLFRAEREKLIPNKSILESYRRVIEKRGQVHGKIEKASPLAIIVTEPFSEYGLATLAVELGLVNAVTDILVQMGFDVCIKPHHLESADKYASVLEKFKSGQVKLLDHKMPIETLFSAWEPACVIGCTSTALVTASTVFAIPTISIIDILTGKADTDYLRMCAREFKRLTEGICYSAGTYERLQQILTSVKSVSGSLQPA